MGAPIGNQNAIKAKRWSDAIDRALAKRSKVAGIEALDDLAEKFLAEVETAGINGYKELGDRIEGKPEQPLSGQIDSNVTVNIVKFGDSPTP